MRNHFLAASLVAATLIPGLAFAQQTCEQRQSNRVVGTVAGAGIGALLGSAVAGHGDKTAGALIGGVGGAVIGNQMTRSAADCAHAYGYYDNNGLWHATGAARTEARGYFDRNGDWVDGQPNGYYGPEGRWIAASTPDQASGYYDRAGRWIPASADGYYAADGQWVAGAASGYYDSNRRWVSGPATGRYDADGRWISGQPAGHRDANGQWIADAQPGHYDSNGRWVAGPVMGYYDTRGRWVATSQAATERAVDATAYEGRSNWGDAQADTRSREAWLDRRIRRGLQNGALTRNEGNRALRTLRSIQSQERAMTGRYGRLNNHDEAIIQARLDDLHASLRLARNDDRRGF